MDFIAFQKLFTVYILVSTLDRTARAVSAWDNNTKRTHLYESFHDHYPDNLLSAKWNLATIQYSMDAYPCNTSNESTVVTLFNRHLINKQYTFLLNQCQIRLNGTVATRNSILTLHSYQINDAKQIKHYIWISKVDILIIYNSCWLVPNTSKWHHPQTINTILRSYNRYQTQHLFTPFSISNKISSWKSSKTVCKYISFYSIFFVFLFFF